MMEKEPFTVQPYKTPDMNRHVDLRPYLLRAYSQPRSTLPSPTQILAEIHSYKFFLDKL